MFEEHDDKCMGHYFKNSTVTQNPVHFDETAPIIFTINHFYEWTHHWRCVFCIFEEVFLVSAPRVSPPQMVMLVKENPLVAEVEALEKCRRVMELICEKCMKQQDMNEVLAMKMHYISCVLGKCASFLKDREDKLDGLVKR